MIYRRPIDGSGFWSRIPGRLKHITAGGQDEVFGVSTLNRVFRCKKPCIGNWERVEGVLLKQCDAAIDEVFGVTATNKVYKRKVTI